MPVLNASQPNFSPLQSLPSPNARALPSRHPTPALLPATVPLQWGGIMPSVTVSGLSHGACNCLASQGIPAVVGSRSHGDPAVTPLCLAALTMAPLDRWVEIHVNVAPHWNRIRFPEKPQLARDGFSRCTGCLDISGGRSLP